MSTTTPALRRRDSPARLEWGDEDLVARSAAVLQAAGFTIIPIVKRIGPFEILAVNPFGLLLCCVVNAAWPATAVGFGRPPGWPHNVLRQIHKWNDGAVLPEALTL